MFLDINTVGIYAIPGFTDMRKQITGLSSVLYDLCDIDLMEPNIFIFCGKSKKILKILYWDRNGFCLWQKKLGKDKFPWPVSKSDIQIIDLEKLHLLLKGIDFWKEHKSIYSKDFF